MDKTVLLAKENDVKVGAHPSLPDLQGFGRREMAIDPVRSVFACINSEFYLISHIFLILRKSSHHASFIKSVRCLVSYFDMT